MIKALTVGLGVWVGAPEGIAVGLEVAEEQLTASNAIPQANANQPTNCQGFEFFIVLFLLPPIRLRRVRFVR
ncbi:MAG: hypothetical protein AB1817_16030 [Chloroflexota bacterium]